MHPITATPPPARFRQLLAWGALAVIATAWVPPVAVHAQSAAPTAPAPVAGPVVGPVSGAVIVAGGGTLEAEIWSRFVELAGGNDAKIVVIPTAGTEDEYTQNWDGLGVLLDVGAGDVTVLHTRSPEVANLERFVDPLRTATGVWLPGGRQWRLVDAYLGTRVHDELEAVLERGGVVGGTSAGASILGSFLVRGDPATNRIIYSDQYRDGFGMLRGTAVDQHLFARNRQDDLWEILAVDPSLLGIGLDEGTALVVHGDQGEVIGKGVVLMYDTTGSESSLHRLSAGDRFDLARRLPAAR